jgi:hypothetical protein
MDYTTLIGEAWRLTWRHRFLWLLGLLAGGAVGMPAATGGSGNGVRWETSQRELEQFNPTVAAAARDIATWASLNAGLLVFAAGLALLVFLALVVLSLIAQGGMARATADLALGQPSSLGRAWRAGLRLFWRYVGLWLITVAAAFTLALVIAAYGALAFVAGSQSGGPAVGFALVAVAGLAMIAAFVVVVLRLTETSTAPRWAVAVGAALFALPLVTMLIALALGVSIVVAYAQRAIAVEDVGPVAALRSGWHLLRAHLGQSLLAWGINAALALGAGIALVASLLGILVVLGAPGAVLVAVIGFSTPTIAYISLGGVALIAAALTLGAIVNTFFWNYWTLAYLRLSAPAAAAA